MSTEIWPVPGHSSHPERVEVLQVIVYGHSALFYWWPLWVAGYVMALLTWLYCRRSRIALLLLLSAR
jgi:hypothetical protein